MKGTCVFVLHSVLGVLLFVFDCIVGTTVRFWLSSVKLLFGTAVVLWAVTEWLEVSHWSRSYPDLDCDL